MPVTDSSVFFAESRVPRELDVNVIYSIRYSPKTSTPVGRLSVTWMQLALPLVALLAASSPSRRRGSWSGPRWRPQRWPTPTWPRRGTAPSRTPSRPTSWTQINGWSRKFESLLKASSGLSSLHLQVPSKTQKVRSYFQPVTDAGRTATCGTKPHQR